MTWKISHPAEKRPIDGKCRISRLPEEFLEKIFSHDPPPLQWWEDSDSESENDDSDAEDSDRKEGDPRLSEDGRNSDGIIDRYDEEAKSHHEEERRGLRH